MDIAVFSIVFIATWISGLIVSILLKARLKGLYPDIYCRAFLPDSFSMNARNLASFSFLFNSKNWSGINDGRLLSWLRLQRFLVSAVLIEGLLMLPLIAS